MVDGYLSRAQCTVGLGSPHTKLFKGIVTEGESVYDRRASSTGTVPRGFGCASIQIFHRNQFEELEGEAMRTAFP
jgi:hypothetical protein